MLLRGLVGASVGFLVGVGFALTLSGFDEYCELYPSTSGCGRSFLLVLLLFFACWMLVAGALIHAGFRLAHVTRGWQVTGIGSALWVLLAVGVVGFGPFLLDVYPKDVRLFSLNGAVVTSCVAYAVAAVSTGRRRTA
ncbi:hypothetical protein ACFOWZ_45030 [Lentzea rhizosphaerae]|uniref:Uncharacterized protein n=1 Tax=Lentzea rhizosphaerae TaxID=2041025 RepID=A0ABV8C9U0_9PSEU